MRGSPGPELTSKQTDEGRFAKIPGTRVGISWGVGRSRGVFERQGWHFLGNEKALPDSNNDKTLFNGDQVECRCQPGQEQRERDVSD